MSKAKNTKRFARERRWHNPRTPGLWLKWTVKIKDKDGNETVVQRRRPIFVPKLILDRATGAGPKAPKPTKAERRARKKARCAARKAAG